MGMERVNKMKEAIEEVILHDLSIMSGSVPKLKIHIDRLTDYIEPEHLEEICETLEIKFE